MSVDAKIDDRRNNYKKIDQKDIDDSGNLLGPHHAVFGALWGKGSIQKYDMYRNTTYDDGSSASPQRRKLIVAAIQVGDRLNGHVNVVHGGIVSLLLDETIGWAYEYLQWLRTGENKIPAFTANLDVNFKSALLQNSEVVIRVYHNKTHGRKIYFSATMQSVDGNTVFAEASSLFIQSTKIISKL